MWTGLLPIGSVVLLKESEKRLMIIGFCQAKPEDTSVVYDYCGCLFPEGYMNAEHLYLFNEDQIETIYSIGYMDEEQFAVRDKISEIMMEIRAGEVEFSEEDDDLSLPESEDEA